MASAADPMSPESSPGGSSSGSRLVTGVRRVNNWPVYIIGGLIVLFLIVVLMVVVERSNEQTIRTDDLQQPSQSKSSMDQARQIVGGVEGGEVPASTPLAPGAPVPPNPVMVPGPVVLDANGVPVAPVNPDMPPVPPGGSMGNAPPPSVSPEVQSRRQRMQAMRDAKLQQFTDAVQAPTNVRLAAARSAGSPSNPAVNGNTAQQLEALRQQIAASATAGNGPSASDLAALAAVQGQLAANGGGAGGGAVSPQQRNDVSQFGNRQGGDRWQSNSQPEAPRSRYELRAGFVIPGTLISGINSQLPGQIVAQVSQNVFDTPTGKFLLIPQGSRLVGEYSSDVQYGQSRVLVAWQRIVFPDGKAMDLGAMPGSDSAGYGGFQDKVNNHYFRIFGSALLLSGVTAGATLSQPQSNFQQFGRQSTGSALSEALGQQLGQVTAELVRKNLNISPTLNIRPGFRFNVVVTKDLAFSKPYRAFDY